jgi:hypothetical protein
MDPAPTLPGGTFSADFEDFISQCLHKEGITAKPFFCMDLQRVTKTFAFA